MIKALLSLRSVSAQYQQQLSLDKINLDLPTASITGIVGSSGSGKTTLARVIAGEITPMTGELFWHGQLLNAKRTSMQLRRIQTIYQDPYTSLNPRLTVGKMLSELLMVIRKISRRDTLKTVEKLLEQVHLPREVADAQPSHLSGGQRQRVAIARALAVEPELLIADEPTSSLDVTVRTAILDLFRELRDNFGLTILFISHDLMAVRYLCSEIVVMHQGRIIEKNNAANIFESVSSDEGRQLFNSVSQLRLQRNL